MGGVSGNAVVRTSGGPEGHQGGRVCRYALASPASIAKITGWSETKIHELRRWELLPMVEIDSRWKITQRARDRADREIMRQFS